MLQLSGQRHGTVNEHQKNTMSDLYRKSDCKGGNYAFDIHSNVW